MDTIAAIVIASVARQSRRYRVEIASCLAMTLVERRLINW